MPEQGKWDVFRFESEFDLWVDRSNPSVDLRVIVFAWILSRLDDPYVGAVREPGFDNLWRARIPDSNNEAGNLVYCVYFVNEAENRVDCRGFEFNSWM